MMVIYRDDVSLEEWLERYPILYVKTFDCDGCGAEMKSDVPFVDRGYVGLTCRPCECGKMRHCAEVLATTTGAANDEWKKTLDSVLD